ncbi:MAG: hypothetical protein K8T91_13630 [Planctomycetes bacterium]|nr:hypothetical protein [Planctomycetota bacterium]
MKYFTPELYREYSTAPANQAQVVEEKWTQAESNYEQSLSKIRAKLPATVRTLADKLCLHDAQIINLHASHEACAIWVRLENVFIVLQYHLLQDIVVTLPADMKVSPAPWVRWLYDEIDMPKSGQFTHDILLSDGREMRIVFDSAELAVFEAHPLSETEQVEAFRDLHSSTEQGPRKSRIGGKSVSILDSVSVAKKRTTSKGGSLSGGSDGAYFRMPTGIPFSIRSTIVVVEKKTAEKKDSRKQRHVPT